MSAPEDIQVRSASLHPADYTLIGIYFVIVIAVGIWTSRSNRNSVKGYFLAGRNQHWIPVGASIFASNIGSQHFTGLAGGGANDGYQSGYYELHAAVIVLCLSWVFVPVYVASGADTMPGYLRLRFGGQRIQSAIAATSLIAYIFTKISVDIYSGTLFIEQATGLNMYLGACLILFVAAVFTIAGGLTAVIWTDFVQTILMIVGASALCIISFVKVGGYSEMVDKYHASIPKSALFTNSTCGLPRNDALHIFKAPDSDSLPWPGAFSGALIKSFWYWCADQVIVQRALAAKSLSHAKAGAVLAGVLKLTPFFLLIMPGLIARILFTETVTCIDPDICQQVCGTRIGCTNIAYSKLVLELMPLGARGLMLAVMLAALMSSMTSVFNSSSTLFTLDIWTKFRKQASQAELIFVGRCFVLLMVGCSLAWLPILKTSQNQIFMYTVRISSYFQSPIIGVFTVAIFANRVTEKGAFWGLVVGGLLGVVRFILDYSWETPTCDKPEDLRPAIVKDIHFLYFAVISFLMVIIIAVVISILTKPIPPQRLRRLTYWTRNDSSPPDFGHEIEELDSKSTEDLNKNMSWDINKFTEELENKTENLEGDEADRREQAQCALPWYKRLFFYACGLNQPVTERTAAAEALEEQNMSRDALIETDLEKTVTNSLAIALITATFFISGFYG